MKENYIEKYQEGYYNGSRKGSYLKRIRGKCKLYKGKKERFKVLKKINKQPQAVGIFSFTLFGNSNKKRFRDKLIEPMLKNIKIIKKNFPLWSGRIYISQDIDPKYLKSLSRAGYELYVMKQYPEEPYTGLLWRFLPAGENKPFISCDADSDSHIILSDTKNIKKWLKSQKAFYRRNLFWINTMQWPISAGVWGGKPIRGKPPVPRMKNMLEKYNHDWFGSDEAFLIKNIWPLFKKHGYYTSLGMGSILFRLFYILIGVGIIIFILCKLLLTKKNTRGESSRALLPT